VALAIIIGIIAGALSFLPLLGALVMTQRLSSTSNLSHASTLLLAVFGSMVVLFGSAVICIFIDRADILPFALGEAVGIIVVAVVFGVRKFILGRKK